MKKSRFTDEQIVAMVQESEASSVAEVARKHKVTEQTVYTWRRRFGWIPASAGMTGLDAELGGSRSSRGMTNGGAGE